MPLWAWPIVIALAFSLWWCFLMWMISHICGWAALARHYRATEQFQGKIHRFCSGKIGWSNYSGCLFVGANSEGLYISVLFPFRIGHPPLFIPWTDVEARTVSAWFIGSYFVLRFEKAKSVWLQFPGKLGRQIAADANQSWAEESASVE